MASQAKTIEAKKDEFRAYLEKTGVVDQLTKVLVSLYEETEKPNNPLETFPIFTYTSTYENNKPINVDNIPTTNPIFKVLEIARLKLGICIILTKVFSDIPLFPYIESIRRIASGYNINTVSAVTSKISVVIIIGSPRSFFLSSSLLCFTFITPHKN